jgi:hypothetical protein
LETTFLSLLEPKATLLFKDIRAEGEGTTLSLL